MKGYKVFNSDWTCRGFQFEVGKTFEEDVDPKCCNRGFHFCAKVSDCFNYYDFDSANKVAEVEALGTIDKNDEDSKCSTNKIHIIRELTWHEVLDIANTGKDCTGICNNGSRNSGNYNNGNWNSGDCNSGNCNSGNKNSGNCNSGDRNSGTYNSGDWNKTSFSAGCFNTKEQKIVMFNKLSNWTIRDWRSSNARNLLNKIPRNDVEWICANEMTEEEKKAHPEYEITGGYLKILDERNSSQIWWDGLTSRDKNIIKQLPNFDAEIFYEITGIRVS